MSDLITPADFESAAAALARAAADGRAVRIVGGGTKRDWGASVEPTALELHTGGLRATVEHNAGDLTAIFQAGMPLARAQQELAATARCSRSTRRCQRAGSRARRSVACSPPPTAGRCAIATGSHGI